MKITDNPINDRYSNAIVINQEETHMNVSKKHQYASLAAMVALSISLAATTAKAESYTPVFDATKLTDILNLSDEATVSIDMFGEQNSGISCGQTVSGVLGEAGDQQFNDGTFVDTLEFDSTNASQFYRVTVNSTAFPGQSAIITGQNALKQVAFVTTPGEQVQYSGTLDNPGRNTLYIHSSDGQPNSRGNYTVSLECKDSSSGGGNPPPSSGVISGTGTAQDPFVSNVNTPITNKLVTTDQALQNRQGGQHFVKYFKPNTRGGTVDVSVSSNNFNPLIVVFDSTGNIVDAKSSSLNIDYDESMLFAVTSEQANMTGSFTITMNQEGDTSSGGSGTLDNPMQFDTNQPLNMKLTATDEHLSDGNGGIHYFKVFQSNNINERITINIQSADFSPDILVFNPVTGEGEWITTGSSVNYNSSLVIVVTSREANATGSFTFNATTSQGGLF